MQSGISLESQSSRIFSKHPSQKSFENLYLLNHQILGATKMPVPSKHIHIAYNQNTVRVYQSFNKEISDYILQHRKFPKKLNKYIKQVYFTPSFWLLMHKTEWGQKKEGHTIFAIDLNHQGFHWALDHCCLDSYDENVHETRSLWKETYLNSMVHAKWENDRNYELKPIDIMALNIQLSGSVIKLFSEKWVKSIHDLNDEVFEIKRLIADQEIFKALTKLPSGGVYNVSQKARRKLGE